MPIIKAYERPGYVEACGLRTDANDQTYTLARMLVKAGYTGSMEFYGAPLAPRPDNPNCFEKDFDALPVLHRTIRDIADHALYTVRENFARAPHRVRYREPDFSAIAFRSPRKASLIDESEMDII